MLVLDESSSDSDSSEDLQSDDDDDHEPEEFQRSKSITDKRYFLPATLLNNPLAPSKVGRLSKKDKKLYNMQKAKYEVTQKAWSKKPLHPSQHKFSLKDAKQLIAGDYYVEEEDHDEMDPAFAAAREAVTNQVLKRTIINVDANNYKKEIELEKFDKKNILNELNQQTEVKDQRNSKDHIPDDIKNTFNLPKDMTGLEIDFEEVRKIDASFKRRQPQWSGQEVLELSLNMEKSHWVVKKFNRLRVWPKGIYN